MPGERIGGGAGLSRSCWPSSLSVKQPTQQTLVKPNPGVAAMLAWISEVEPKLRERSGAGGIGEARPGAAPAVRLQADIEHGVVLG